MQRCTPREFLSWSRVAIRMAPSGSIRSCREDDLQVPSRSRPDLPDHPYRAGNAGHQRGHDTGHRRAGADGHEDVHHESGAPPQLHPAHNPVVRPSWPSLTVTAESAITSAPCPHGLCSDHCDASPDVSSCEGIVGEVSIQARPAGASHPIAPRLDGGGDLLKLVTAEQRRGEGPSPVRGRAIHADHDPIARPPPGHRRPSPAREPSGMPTPRRIAVQSLKNALIAARRWPKAALPAASQSGIAAERQYPIFAAPR